MHPEHQYLALAKTILERGHDRPDRTGTGTRGLFGAQMRFDLAKGYPLLTTKRLNFKAIAVELLWFLRGETNIKYLHEHGVKIWDAWADEHGELGPIYGKQWRAWAGADGTTIDQISQALDTIKYNPMSRRIIVSAWNVGELEQMALPPCHAFFQFYVDSGRLSCQLYQRSADLFLGVPFNIASYSLLLTLMAKAAGLAAGEFVHTFGDVHIYHNHLEQMREQIAREPLPFPQLVVPEVVENIFAVNPQDISLQNYQAHPHIRGEIAV